MTDLDQILRLVNPAADMAYLRDSHPTRAAAVRAAVKAAFECAVGNGLIRLVPADEHPEYVVMDPPYRLPT